MEYLFDFSQSLDELNHSPTTHVGNPRLELDEVDQLRSCRFDRQSGIQLPPVPIGSTSFSLEVVFRNLAGIQESGIFGSDGFRLALRTNRKAKNCTFWANFPSANDKKSIDFELSEQEWNTYHHVGILRQGNEYKLLVDGKDKGQLNYNYDFGSFNLYLGYYYDPMYGLDGYIRKYRFKLGSPDLAFI